MGYSIVKKTCDMIFSNEGNYCSVNRNDNGAVSVGRLQWHADRAKDLLIAIIRYDTPHAVKCLTTRFYNEILTTGSWSERIVDEIEGQQIRLLLGSTAGIVIQDRMAEKDVQGYLNFILKYDITDENSLILLADICNQGGTGAVKRIITKAFKVYGKYATLDQFMETAITDKVFKKYQQRRFDLYRRLTNKSYKSDLVNYLSYIVKQGENLTTIAHKYGTTVKRLVQDNEIKEPDLIRAGQVIKIYK